nr:DUF2207 domain-containing protein [Kineosphaera limosa]
MLDSNSGTLRAASASGERILDYRVEYELQPDGTLRGRDTIQYQFQPGREQRGIFVTWPIRLPLQGETDRYRLYPLEVTGVSSPTGAPSDYEVSDQRQSRVVRIGNPDVFVSGLQTYVIDYRVQGTVNDFADHQELYVNPIGMEWEVPIDRATVVVTAPQAGQQYGCVVGPRLSAPPEGQQPTSANCTASADGNSVTFEASSIPARQGMTVGLWYPAHTVAESTAIYRTGDPGEGGGIGESLPQPVAKALTATGYGAGVLVPTLAAVGMGVLVRRRGRDEQYAGLTPGLSPTQGEGAVVRGRRDPVAVRFTPPDGETPGLVGTILDESADTRDVSATVVDLAVRGWLQIEEIETGKRKKADWELRRTAPEPDETLLGYEREIYDGLFQSGDTVTLSGLRNHFATTLALAKKGMYREVVNRGWYRRSPEATRNSWMALAMVVAIIGGIVLFAGGIASTSIDNASGMGIFIPSGVVLGAGILLAAVIVFVLGLKMPARTAKGSAVYAQTLGFRQYLETAEANQIKFEEAQSIFSRYLPYAIVFGCAERWAKVFNEVAEAAELQGYTIDMPTWYIFYGAHTGMFNFGSIADGMEDFATTAAGTFAATPGSSGESAFGSGGSSGGFGGGGGSFGGFSGGGGFGGGGGGSW